MNAQPILTKKAVVDQLVARLHQRRSPAARTHARYVRLASVVLGTSSLAPQPLLAVLHKAA